MFPSFTDSAFEWVVSSVFLTGGVSPLTCTNQFSVYLNTTTHGWQVSHAASELSQANVYPLLNESPELPSMSTFSANIDPSPGILIVQLLVTWPQKFTFIYLLLYSLLVRRVAALKTLSNTPYCIQFCARVPPIVPHRANLGSVFGWYKINSRYFCMTIGYFFLIISSQTRQ